MVKLKIRPIKNRPIKIMIKVSKIYIAVALDILG